jgi:hypothetical protein
VARLDASAPGGPTLARLHASMASARPSERATARRLARQPAFRGRTFRAPPPPDPGYDWRDDLGRRFDAVGDGTAAGYLKVAEFIRSVDRHLRKGNEFTVIDLTGYTSAQIRPIKEHIDGLPAAQRSTIIRIGF